MHIMYIYIIFDILIYLYIRYTFLPLLCFSFSRFFFRPLMLTVVFISVPGIQQHEKFVFLKTAFDLTRRNP